MRNYISCVLMIFLGMSIAMAEQVKYFPAGVLSANKHSDHFRSEWYSKQLEALKEPSLWELSKAEGKGRESYRFLWLRTFHHPVAVRVEIGADGIARLIVKMAGGAGGYAPGGLVQDETTTLGKEQTDLLVTIFEKNEFWKLPSSNEAEMGLDGAQWIIEAVKGGKYHIVDRWSPKDGAVRMIGLTFIKEFAKLSVPAKEIY